MGMFTILMGWWFHRYIHMSKFTTVRILNAQFVSIDIKLQKLYFIVLLAQQLTAFFKPIYESHHKSHYLTDTPPFWFLKILPKLLAPCQTMNEFWL